MQAPWYLRFDGHVHFIAVFLLGLCLLAWFRRWSLPSWAALLTVAVVVAIDETIQAYVPGRTADWLDLSYSSAAILALIVKERWRPAACEPPTN